jgi:tetratricopeptide (TPR) repeat protein
MPGRRVENESLRMLLSTTGWTYEALARAVNALGTENGVRLRYDRSSVAHWLAGSVPRPRTRLLIAEAFSRRLRRPVSPADLDMEDRAPASPIGLGPDGGRTMPGRELDAAASLAALCAMDADPARRTLLRQSVYSATGLDAPPWRELLGRSPSKEPRAGNHQECVREVEGLRAAVEFFNRASDLGGGYARTSLIAHLNDDIAPRLHAHADCAMYRQLLSEAARLVHVLARMYVDVTENGAAQQYFRAALHLAAEAGDRTAYAVVLRGMSSHALDLGHRRAARRLSETAERTAPAEAPVCVRVYLLSQLALAQAACGEQRPAAASLAAAERLHGRTPAPDAVDGGVPYSYSYSWASFAFQKGRTLATLGDRVAAISALRSSLEHRPATAYRSRALTHALLARLLLRSGLLEEACVTWHRFLDDYPHLRSGRADRALTELRQNLLAHEAHGPVRALLHRAGLAAPPPA